MVRLVQNEQRAGAKLAEHVAQAGRIDLIGQQAVRDDEARAGRPGIHGKAPKPPHLAYPLPVDDFERKTEFRFEFVLPLDRHRRRGRNDDEIDPAAQQQLARDETRLDCLTEPHVVRDQEVDARKPQRLAKRQKLIGIQPNACPKRRLQQIAVSGCRRSPPYGPQVGRQHFGPVRKPLADIPPSVLVEHDGADFGIPEDLEPLALGVVGNTGQAERLKVAIFAADSSTSHGRPRSSTKLPCSRVATTLVCDMSSFFSAFR